MDTEESKQILSELTEAFGDARDVTPDIGQPLHVMLSSLMLPAPWKPKPTKALIKFENWPNQRPLFWVDLALANSDGQPPRSNSAQLVLGETWRQFSFNFAWPIDPLTPMHAVLKWLTRFREAT
jgi:hypothetical protein